MYEHVGISVCIYPHDTSGITNRLTKARRTFNALTGLGIRRSGPTMATCNIIFWSIIVPVALYGCEVWRLNDDSISELENFQNYTCKKIQRFHPRVPNASSLYSLGWMRLERYVQIKKLLFVRSIMAMNDGEVAKVFFVERTKSFYLGENNIPGEWSIVHDILTVVSLFGLETEIRNMVERDYSYDKSVWKRIVWEKAWHLEDVFWRIEVNLRTSLDVISMVNVNPRYLVWWSISDNDHTCMYFCETMARIVCHASLLKLDDLRLKSQHRTARLCSHCDLSAIENARHIIMQCPNLQEEQAILFSEINQVAVDANCLIFNVADDILPTLLGRAIFDLPTDLMVQVWKIAGRNIHKMYKLVIKCNEGIG